VINENTIVGVGAVIVKKFRKRFNGERNAGQIDGYE